jgi:hypothetical protein
VYKTPFPIHGMWNCRDGCLDLFHRQLFPDLKNEGLKKSIPSKQSIPNATLRIISNPIPDILYGYDRISFAEHQAELISLGNAPVANSQDLLFPFFMVEFKRRKFVGSYDRRPASTLRHGSASRRMKPWIHRYIRGYYT